MPLVLVVLVTSCAAGRAEPGPRAGASANTNPNGTALLDGGNGYSLGFVPFQSGSRVGAIYVPLINESDAVVILRTAEATGEGLGKILEIEDVKVAPSSGDDTAPLRAYATDPPTTVIGRFCPRVVVECRKILSKGGAWHGRNCAVARLWPLDGYLMEPGEQVHLWQVLHYLSPGSYDLTGFRITYETSDGRLVSQHIPFGFYGDVTERGPTPEVHGGEGRCKSMTHRLPQP